MGPPSMSPEWLAQDRSGPLRKTSIVFIVLETVFIILFFVSRYVNRLVKGRHDRTGVEILYLMPLGYIFNVAEAAMMIVAVDNFGTGHHVPAVPPAKLIKSLKLLRAIEPVYIVSIFFTKLAIVCLYLRIFTSQSRAFRTAIYGTGAIIVVSTIVFLITSFTSCTPYAFYWDKTIPGGKCIDLMAVYRAISFPNITTDIVMLILPLPVLFRLKLETPAKLGLIITFLTGSLGIITAILRLAEFLTVNVFQDFSWEAVTTGLWSVIEPGAYLIAAILPTLRPLLHAGYEFVSVRSGRKQATEQRSTGYSGQRLGPRSDSETNIIEMKPMDSFFSKKSETNEVERSKV